MSITFSVLLAFSDNIFFVNNSWFYLHRFVDNIVFRVIGMFEPFFWNKLCIISTTFVDNISSFHLHQLLKIFSTFSFIVLPILPLLKFFSYVLVTLLIKHKFCNHSLNDCKICVDCEMLKSTMKKVYFLFYFFLAFKGCLV